jgi:hypothetical protein
MIILTAWRILKQPNMVIFNYAQPNVACLLNMVSAEAGQWSRARKISS